MAVQANLLPIHKEKTLKAMKAERALKRITFDRSEARPSETLYVSVPKVNAKQVLVPCSLSLLFKVDLEGCHANNFLVQNVTLAGQQAGCEVFGNHTAEHAGPRHLQELGGPFPLTGGVGPHTA